jgi:hypothetical protein
MALLKTLALDFIRRHFDAVSQTKAWEMMVAKP